jgi:ribosomal protein S18 acetylase RimI-like enzyme
MTLEAAGEADAGAVTEVVNAAYREAESFFHAGPRTTVDEVRARLGRGTFLVARGPEGVDGCVYVESDGARGYLGMLAVSPRRQGSGLGPRLVQAGEAYLRQRGVALLAIDVISLRQELLGFYDRLGYRVTGTRPFEDPKLLLPCHLVVMEKSLGAQDPSRGTAG